MEQLPEAADRGLATVLVAATPLHAHPHAVAGLLALPDLLDETGTADRGA